MLVYLDNGDQSFMKSSFYRHQIQHYTQQLAKDTSVHLRDLAILANNSGSTSPGEQRQRKMQRERLQDEFTTALNSFQVNTFSM